MKHGFALQRVTGLLLLAYLFLHVRTIHRLSEGPRAFDQALAAFQNPFFKLLEIGLLGVVIAHGLNGVRIMLIDFSAGNERRLWNWSVAAATVLFLLGALPLFLAGVWGRS